MEIAMEAEGPARAQKATYINKDTHTDEFTYFGKLQLTTPMSSRSCRSDVGFDEG
jgi:hypothetical protein